MAGSSESLAADEPGGDGSSEEAVSRRFIGSALAQAVREGWCCRNCGGGFCLHVSPSRCPSCGAPTRRTGRRADEEES